MVVIDTHLHLWDASTYYRLNDDWLEAYPDLKRSFLPAELQAHFHDAEVQSGIVIEAGRDSHLLNQWLLQIAQDNGHLAGVVAGVWLHNARKFEWLDQYCESPHFLGIRTHPPGNPEHWTDDAALSQLLGYLSQRDRVFELLITYEMCAAVVSLARMYPDLVFVIDHCGLPPIQDSEYTLWQKEMLRLAQCSNVFIKFSTHKMSPLTEGFKQRLQPVLDFLIEQFSPARLMWGSNYPVETRGGTYTQVIDQFRQITASFSPTEKMELFELTAKRAYRLTT